MVEVVFKLKFTKPSLLKSKLFETVKVSYEELNGDPEPSGIQ